MNPDMSILSLLYWIILVLSIIGVILSGCIAAFAIAAIHGSYYY